MTTIYKIRHKVTGLYSKGGTNPRWSTKGKAWTSIGALKNHLGLLAEEQRGPSKDMDNWEIVTLVLHEKGRQPVKEALQTIMEVRAARQEKRQKREREWYLQRKEQEFERLKRELGK